VCDVSATTDELIDILRSQSHVFLVDVVVYVQVYGEYFVDVVKVVDSVV